MNTEANQIADSEQPSKGGADWKFALLGGLGTQSARRIFTAGELLDFVREYRPTASASTARSTADMLVAAGALRRVSSGVFLNRRSSPPAEMVEVAHHIRSGAVISMNSVLGKCGFLNNTPDEQVTAVLPTSAAKRPKLGELVTSTGDRFRFFGLAEKFFPTNSDERFEMLQPGSQCETFRPEAALLQWLHLAGMERSKLTAPPVDVDMSALDEELLGKLAKQWELEPELTAWRAKAESLNFGDEREVQSAAPESTTESVDRSDAAKQRLKGRRPA